MPGKYDQGQILTEVDKYPTFDELLMQYMTNPIQRKVVQMLRPIAKKIPDQFIEGALQVWLKKSMLGSNINLNKSYEKIIQMIVCVYQASENPKTAKIDFILPTYQVIQSMITYIIQTKANDQKDTLVNMNRWNKNSPVLSVTQTVSETLLCSFLYSYLVYHPSMYDPLFERHSEEKIREFQKVYAVMIKFFNTFRLSRNPFTINW